MFKNRTGKVGAAVAALLAVVVGASAVAGAASGGSTTSQSYAPQGTPQGGPPRGGHAGHKPETPLSGAVASKVRAAALAKVPGGTIERVETDSDHGSPYEAHVRKSDGTELEVLVNKSFAVTAVNTMRHP